MEYRVMTEADIERVIPLYISYYNENDGSCWTHETTYKRIHQIWSREDSLCIILEDNDDVVGFSMGSFEQFDDISAYNLVEIVISSKYQNKGIGTKFMLEIERQVVANGGSMISLDAVNDDRHERFYGRLNYGNVGNMIAKTKWLV